MTSRGITDRASASYPHGPRFEYFFRRNKKKNGIMFMWAQLSLASVDRREIIAILNIVFIII